MENTTGPTAAGLALPSPPSYSLTLESWGLLGIRDCQPQEVGRSLAWHCSCSYTGRWGLLGSLGLDITSFSVVPDSVALLPCGSAYAAWPTLFLLSGMPFPPFICLVSTYSGVSTQLKCSFLQETFPGLPGWFRILFWGIPSTP